MKLQISHIFTASLLILTSVQAGPLDDIGMPFGLNQRFNNAVHNMRNIEMSDVSQQASQHLSNYAHQTSELSKNYPAIAASIGVFPVVGYISSVHSDARKNGLNSNVAMGEAYSFAGIGTAAGLAASYRYNTNSVTSAVAGAWTGCALHATVYKAFKFIKTYFESS